MTIVSHRQNQALACIHTLHCQHSQQPSTPSPLLFRPYSFRHFSPNAFHCSTRSIVNIGIVGLLKNDQNIHTLNQALRIHKSDCSEITIIIIQQYSILRLLKWNQLGTIQDTHFCVHVVYQSQRISNKNIFKVSKAYSLT